MYRRNTASICFCWNLPFITNWLDPSRLPKKIEFKIIFLEKSQFSKKKSLKKSPLLGLYTGSEAQLDLATVRYHALGAYAKNVYLVQLLLQRIPMV